MIYTRKQIDKYWNEATVDMQRDPNVYRKDFAGAWIRKDMYGYQSPFGWTICRIRPKSLGGTDNDDNLMVAHWRNNRFKGTNYPSFKSVVTSAGTHNITMIQSWQAK